MRLAARIIAAVIGGYLLASAVAAATAVVMPGTDGVLAGTMLGFVAYPAAVLGVFATIRPGLRQAMAWLHGWAGLIVGWLLFAIFLTGTLAYYRVEISQWMLRPPAGDAAVDPAVAAARVLDWLASEGAGAPEWVVTLPTEREPWLRASWRKPGMARPQSVLIDPATGAQLAGLDSCGGDFFYRFHFELTSLAPVWGRWIVGIAAMTMLVAIVSGVITHKRIFRDFFTFRPGKAGGRSWLDGHNALAALALPYHLMITYTGLVTLMFLYLPAGLLVGYRGDTSKFFADMADIPSRPTAAAPAMLAPIGPMLAAAPWPVRRIDVQRPGRTDGVVVLHAVQTGALSVNPGSAVFDAATGTMLRPPSSPSIAGAIWGAAYGLHLGRFAEGVLRALFFVAGLAGSAMVATGLVLWTAKRAPGRGRALVHRLNVAAIVGLPFAVAAFFWANRLLPADLAGRAEWEVRAFFAAWAISLAFARWRPMLVLAAVAYAGLAVVDGVPAAFNLVLGMAGLVFAAAAWKVRA